MEVLCRKAALATPVKDNRAYFGREATKMFWEEVMESSDGKVGNGAIYTINVTQGRFYDVASRLVILEL